MRHKLELWLEALLAKYETLRVSYVLVLALLLILIGSIACSTAQPEKPSTTGNATASPTAAALPTTVTNETKNPLSDLAAAAAAGKTLFEVNCGGCHGAKGDSDSLFEPKPPRLDIGEVTQDSDGEIFLVTKNGKGKAMPAQKRMSDEEIWQVVAFVRTLAKK